MATYEASWSFKILIGKDQTWRDRIGSALRGLARRIDRRYTMAVRIETAPRISRAEEIECLEFSVKQLKFAVSQTVQQKAEEVVIQAMIKEKHGAST